jgi:3-methyladenine DNA glycosylase AlkD
MTLKSSLAQLKSLGDEKVRLQNRKNGAADNQFGVRLGDIRKLAAKIMNFCLAGIGIHVPKLRNRAIAIGEKLGLYRDYPVSKGCTSPFAPIWINEMVRRQS